MPSITPKRIRRGLMSTLALAAAVAVAAPVPALADPPPWAPAHGYRAKKQKHLEYYRYGDGFLERPAIVFGEAGGACNRDVIGMILGGAAGGLAGTQIGKGDGRTVAIIAGAVLGAAIGRSIGESMDNVDRHCLGTTLEHAPANRTVVWRDEQTGRDYAVRPEDTYIGDGGGICRNYTMRVTVGGQAQTGRGVACRQPDGDWRIVS